MLLVAGAIQNSISMTGAVCRCSYLACIGGITCAALQQASRGVT